MKDGERMERYDPFEAHLMDVYKALGVRWGDDPFAVIDHLKESDELWTEAHNETIVQEATIRELVEAGKEALAERISYSGKWEKHYALKTIIEKSAKEGRG
jgi:hypothetical protein